MRKRRKEISNQIFFVCVCEGKRAVKMAEGQGDIEAITLMKTNEGYGWRET